MWPHIRSTVPTVYGPFPGGKCRRTFLLPFCSIPCEDFPSISDHWRGENGESLSPCLTSRLRRPRRTHGNCLVTPLAKTQHCFQSRSTLTYRAGAAFTFRSRQPSPWMESTAINLCDLNWPKRTEPRDVFRDIATSLFDYCRVWSNEIDWKEIGLEMLIMDQEIVHTASREMLFKAEVDKM